MIFEEPPTGGFSRAIWLEYANRQTFKGDESGEFPHEVGLFLSYPPEDVKGFIDHRARASNAPDSGRYTATRKKHARYSKNTKNARISTAHFGKAA